MTVDHRINWDSQERETAQTLAGIIIVIFPIGVPLLLFILLFFNRNQIMQRQTRSGDKRLEFIGEFHGVATIFPPPPLMHCNSLCFTL